MSWQFILNTVVAGTERRPLPEEELLPLGLPPSGDPAQTALEALAAGNLLRKAGFQLAVGGSSGGSGGSSETASSICPPAAVKDLNLMLSGRYADVLPEFLNWLVQRKMRLPPELLPALLDNAERDAGRAEIIRPALGPRGEWLARQNPRWQGLAAYEETDWFTASFAGRKLLLRRTRARNPLLALAWLEKTWLEEKADHKVQFLDALHVRLSPADEDLLERAFSDKNREVRLAAAQALVLLPESRVLAEMKAFFKERFAEVYLPPAPLQRGIGFAPGNSALPFSIGQAQSLSPFGGGQGGGKQGREKDPNDPIRDILKKSLPDLSEEALRPWFSLLPAAAKSDWRNELLRLFISLLPPAALLNLTGLSREDILRALDETKNAEALLETLIRHNDDAWTETVLRHFSGDFRHTIWQSKEMTAFLTRFAVESMAFLQKNAVNIGADNACFLRALENYTSPWPKPLLDHLLDQYRRAAIAEEAEIPGWHYTAALKAAALHCRPEDAAGNAFVRHYLQNPGETRPREFEEFLAIVHFRQKMREHLKK